MSDRVWAPNWDKIFKMIDGMMSIDIRMLTHGDILEIKTRNNLYIFKIDDPEKKTAEITSSDERFNEPIKVAIVGSRIAPSSLSIKPDQIVVGLNLELIKCVHPEATDQERVENYFKNTFVLPETTGISVNGRVLTLPGNTRMN